MKASIDALTDVDLDVDLDGVDDATAAGRGRGVGGVGVGDDRTSCAASPPPNARGLSYLDHLRARLRWQLLHDPPDDLTA